MIADNAVLLSIVLANALIIGVGFKAHEIYLETRASRKTLEAIHHHLMQMRGLS